jgi:hypothetical protein
VTPSRGRPEAMWRFVSANQSIDSAQRHGGKGRSDAVRLLTRGTLRRVTASRGGLRSPKRDEPHGRRQGATNLPALVRRKPSRW